MAYKGEDFTTGNTTVSVRVYDDGRIRISEVGHGNLSEEEGSRMAEFIRDEVYQVRKERGDFDPVQW